MRIDERIEEQVREAYRGVVARDGDRIVTAFRGLAGHDATTALAYGVYVVGYVVNDIFRDGVTGQGLHGVADRMIDATSEWIDLGSKTNVVSLMASAAKGDLSFEGVPKDDVLGHTFVVGGYLLQAYRSDDQQWWDYLGEIWAELETAPEPT